MLDKTIGQLVRDAESNYVNGTTQISDFVSFNLKDNVNQIDAYLNSKHISGDTDSQNREKPFFNICTAAVNIWFRATDIDRKNIRIKATKAGDYILAFLASIHLQEFMRRSGFGVFLNEWGRTLAKYGSAVVKFIEKDGELYPEVIPWNRLICDPVDFDNDIKVEKLYFTPAQLKKNKSYDKEMVGSLLENAKSVRRNLGFGMPKDSKADYIEIYEIHGELPLSYLTDEEDDEEIYAQQMHIISFRANKKSFDDYTLYRGRESKDPYMITHLIKEDGRTQSIGAVEHLFEAQWMVNHTMKTIKDQLDHASKIIHQTSDGSFVGRNVLTNIENGDILIHAVNQPLTEVNNTSHDITALQNQATTWKSLGNEINGIAESMIMQAKSGTAWRQTQAELAEAHSLFELMTENKGLHIEEMMRKYVIPFLKKKMDTTEEISATLESHQIKQIDSMYVPNEAIRRSNKAIKESILKGEIPEPMDRGMMEQEIQKGLNQFGNQRFIKPSEIPTKTWKKVFSDLEWQVEVEVTNEQTDKQAVLDTLNTALQVVVNPAYASNPDAKMIVGKILEETSVLSPLELSMQSTPAVPVAGGSSVGLPVTAMK